MSFAGEDREYVAAVADALASLGLRVFYDSFEQANLWGKDLYTQLAGIYQQRSRFCVVFMSKHYQSKLWTNHERSNAQARALLEHDEYILPVRIDDTEVPGIRATTGYINKAGVTAEQLAMLIRSKVLGFA